MRSSHKLLIASIVTVTAAAGLPEWVATLEGGGAFETVFYRVVTFGANTVSWRRPPSETRPLLAEAVRRTPTPELRRMEALEAEAALDFPAAEAAWRAYAGGSPDKPAAFSELAAYYRRRVEPEKEIAALLDAARLPAAGPDRFRAARAQASWRAFDRAAEVTREQLLPEERLLAVYTERERRYPAEAESFTAFHSWLLSRKRWDDSEALVTRYVRAFPADAIWPLTARASTARARGGAAAAVAVYEAAYRPDAPEPVLTGLFARLDEAGTRRAFVAEARRLATADPAAVLPASRLFHHFRLSGDMPNAQRMLHELARARGERWSPAERMMMAGLYSAVEDFENAASHLARAYASGDASVAESALAGLIDLLNRQAGNSFRFGAGDLSFYRDIATLDAAPGFWNGILSLILNGQAPGAELREQETKAIPYFHRAAAASLLRVFDQRFAASPRRPALHEAVIQAASLHAEADRVAKLGAAFLATFPKAPERVSVALATAAAYAKLNQPEQEFALYDALLKELAANADGVPLGESAQAARNPDYPRVLDRYISRLTTRKQPARALALFRREIDANPEDPGLLERLAAYLEQNRLTGEIEASYRRALQKFPERDWSHRLARYFLRQKLTAKYDEFTREMTAVFSGTQLAEYLRVTATQGSLDPVLYRQVNLYAHRRFPHHLPFVRNLLAAYSARATADPAEWERLLRAHWMYDAALRDRFFAHLSRGGRLQAELTAVSASAQSNPAASLWVAEAEAWRGHYEDAAPRLAAIAASYPADRELSERAAALYRSAATVRPEFHAAAVAIEERLASALPADAAVLTRIGELHAETEDFGTAATAWDRIISTAPGRGERYLEAATLYWDYYRYDDALARISQARAKLNDPALFAFEAGAIHENRGDRAAAAREYAAGSSDGEDSNARRRLLRVAGRPEWRDAVNAAAGSIRDPERALALRVAILESQTKKADIQALLAGAVPSAGPEMLTAIRNHARRSGLTDIERRVLERELSLAPHPAARMASIAERMRLEESANAPAEAVRFAEMLVRENPRSLGAIRTAVHFHSRNGRQNRAVELLLAAAPSAYPALGRSFRLEAIQRMNESGDLSGAAREAATLLVANPLDEPVITLRAETFARAGDDRGLAVFYRDSIATIAKAQIPAQEKARRTAAVRRASIPALLRLGEAQSAADQYIELLRQFPEDEALLREAARTAGERGQTERLRAYFAKAETDSPRDARWPVVRARLETEFGGYEAALAAWGRAVALRPERLDLLSNRASLEERLGRNAEAVASYRKAYTVSFQNPRWLEEGARVLARMGKGDECEAWLREAFVDGRPASLRNRTSAALRLIEWGMPTRARAQIEPQLASAPDDGDLDVAASTLARAAAIERQYESAGAALDARAATLSAERQPGFRERWLIALAAAAGPLYTPEEKGALATWLATRPAVSPEALANAALAAGLPETAATVYAKALLAEPAGERAEERLNQLERLQGRRQQFAELGRQLEAYHRVYPNRPEKTGLLHRARAAYHAAGDDASEMRLLQVLDSTNALGGEERTRLFALTTRRVPATLTPRQAANAAYLDALANYALSANKPAIAEQAILNRRTPLWQNAQRALAGLYFGDARAVTGDAFRAALGPERIGEKLQLAGNRETVLAGGTWFQFAGRYGAWLQLAGSPDGGAYLAAAVERRPESAEAYLALGEESAPAAAAQAYRTALTLDEHLPRAYSGLGALALASGDRSAAAAHWLRAIQELDWWHRERGSAEWFWDETSSVLRDAAKAGLADTVREPGLNLVQAYVRRNGAYRVRELLEAALPLTGGSGQDIRWLETVARSAPDPAAFLAQLNNENWLADPLRDPLRKLQLDLAEAQAATAVGDAREMAREALTEARIRYAASLAHSGRSAAAAPLVELLAADRDLEQRFDVLELRFLVAAERSVEPLLARIDTSSGQLRSVANSLRRYGKAAAARRVLAEAYTLEIRAGDTESAIPGLAAIHLEENRADQALRLLDSFVMDAPVPFARHERAAAVLSAAGRAADAQRYLAPLVGAEPWNGAARLRLAVATADDAAAATALANPAVPYAERVAAAEQLAQRPRPVSSGAAEIDWIASGATDSASAEQPYWAAGRLRAATASAPAVRYRLLRAVLAIRPDDEAAAAALFRTLLAAGRPLESLASLGERTYLLTEAADRARLADAYARTGRRAQALGILEGILDGDPSADRDRWRAQANSLRLQVDLDQRNAERRPLIAAGLEQSNVVRPRLTLPAGGAQ